MATVQQREQARQEVRTSLDKVLSFKKEDLVRAHDLGVQSDFSGGAEAFNQLLQLYDDLAGCRLELLSFDHLQQVKGITAQAATIFQTVQDYQAAQGPAVRDGIIQQARDAYDAHLNVLAPLLSYAYAKGTDIRQLEREVRDIAERMREEAEGSKRNAEELLAEVRGVLKTVRDAAAQVGVAQHATNFADEAKHHDSSTGKWLISTLVLSLFGMGALLLLFVGPFHPRLGVPGAPDAMTTGQALYEVAWRVLVFSVFSYAVLWSSRNYMAHRHNYVVNKHRQNALTTFETFVKAAGEDKDVKNAVLLHASQCIFNPQATGYLSREPMPAPPRNFIEVIQKAISPHDQA